MAPSNKSYPRSAIRKAIKAYSGCKVEKNIEALIWLDYVCFMEQLMKEASIEMKTRGEKKLSPQIVNRAGKKVGAKFNV